MRAFICHSSKNADFVIEIAKHLKRNLIDGVFIYEENQRGDQGFIETINEELSNCEVFVIIAGRELTEYQKSEINAATKLHNSQQRKHFFTIHLFEEVIHNSLNLINSMPAIIVESTTSDQAYKVGFWIIKEIKIEWQSEDGLPYNPHLFSYEKDIINFYYDKIKLENQQNISEEKIKGFEEKEKQIREKLIEGCPVVWPQIFKWKDTEPTRNLLSEDEIGKYRSEQAKVLPASIITDKDVVETCIDNNLFFSEAGPREYLYLPHANQRIKVAIIVSGGIAPGINSVIDGIVQRHHIYDKKHNLTTEIIGIINGFRAFDDFLHNYTHLLPEITKLHANKAGSILNTSRVEELVDVNKRKNTLDRIINQLINNNFDILYVIGGDGSMKAAHALWNIAKQKGERLRVVAIPKTMDNDILWVWQSFGFLSAVEKAREVIEHITTEVASNPRLCIVQLFGSDSGFVVSHAVLASQTGSCDVALIPEVKFSMRGLVKYLKENMLRREEKIPRGLVIMAETAIPTDAMDYVNEISKIHEIGLSEEEKKAIKDFDEDRKAGKRIQGQTPDELRNAGLKIVSKGLHKMLPGFDIKPQVDWLHWTKLRVFTNEPRHLLRAIPPNFLDIIIGHRLGTLAVDNVLAGYTDFMISQWLTEYVLVPLKIVALGRKRIPETGIFWKSVLSKTGQPADLENY